MHAKGDKMILGASISEAYVGMLKHTLTKSPLMQVTMVQPVSNFLMDDVRKTFEQYVFPDGRTGKIWIRGRLEALFDENGEYWKPMRRAGQFHYILSALRGMTKGTMPRWNANRLVISLFNPKEDLHKSRCPTPPCLITLSFHPIRQDLTMIATFRAQYTDAKGYGNLLSLAMLLVQICETTGFKPFKLFSIAEKAILKYSKSTAKDLLAKLLCAVK